MTSKVSSSSSEKSSPLGGSTKSPSRTPSPPFPAIDKEKPVFSLAAPNHNILLHIEDNEHKRCVWCRCQRCGKWRKWPVELRVFGLSLPSLCPVGYTPTPAQLALIPPNTTVNYQSLLNHKFQCSFSSWDLDIQVCGAPQHNDVTVEWGEGWLPLRFYRTTNRFDFIMSLTHFLYIRGVDLQYPWIRNKAVDLYTLYSAVHQLGGPAECDRTQAWTYLYNLLKLPEPAEPQLLRTVYQRIFFEDNSGNGSKGKSNGASDDPPGKKRSIGNGTSTRRRVVDDDQHSETSSKRMRID